jgi:predicted phosphoribosyltransferase
MDDTNKHLNVHHNYFKNREQAGLVLAERLQKYRYEDTIVLALSEGGVLVGSQIATHLHSLIALLLTKDIYLPDGRTLMGVVNETGGFIYNKAFSTGEIEELESEYRNNIEIAKMQAVHDLHIVLGQGGLIQPGYFRDRIVIVVTDGALNGMAFEMAYQYLKGINVRKVIMVAPIASVKAVDRMHLLADELMSLSVIDSTFDTDHYYEDNKLPEHSEVIKILNDIILQWKQEKVKGDQV